MNQFDKACEKLGLKFDVIKFDESTHTAQQAADQLGTSLAQIAKSIVMKTQNTDKPILIITSGANRSDMKKIEALVNEPVEKADANFVKEKTGYTIGCVAAIGHLTKPIIFLDEDLKDFDVIYSAAGRNDSVYPLTPKQLVEITGAEFKDIKE